MNRSIVIAFLALITITSCTKKKEYVKNSGQVFGTLYHFSYESKKGINLESELLNELKKFNSSLSTYDSTSIISRINQNDPSVILDHYFIRCWEKGVKISELTNGAFDMTVAPIVNAWGFGFDENIKADSNKIDSLMQFVGYKKIKIINNKIHKATPGIMLDASAIAKGLGVDIASEFIEAKGIENYMIEIGGEVRAKGVNPKGKYWRIGIDKPIDDPIAMNRKLETIVSLKDKSLATSGNYRQFYIKNNTKYAHTINPKTGYPALSKLLSTTVLANDCMTADALATAFLVLGTDESIKLSLQLEDIEVFFIYSDSTNQFKTYTSKNFFTK